MKAAFKVGRENYEIRDVPMPAVAEGQCLVRIRYCAICVWCYEDWLRDGGDQYGPGETGHEISGVVEQVGPGAGVWKKGDPVVVYIGKHCGLCPACQAGQTMYCWKESGCLINGYAEYIAVPSRNLLPVPPGIDLPTATLLTDMVGTAMHAIRRAFEVDLPRQSAAVWGLGPVGAMLVQGLRAMGVPSVIAIDPVAYRRNLAAELGATAVLDPADPALSDRLQAQSGGRGIDYAFTSTPSAKATEIAYRTLRKNGYLMNVGGGAVTTEPLMEKRVDASFYYHKREHDENVRLVQAGSLRLAPLLTHVLPLEQVNQAMRIRSKQPETSMKVVLECAD